jgi:hypothetical protein
MVYAQPSLSPSTSTTSTATEFEYASRPGHRRTRSQNLHLNGSASTTFTSSAPALPRRRSKSKSFYLEDGSSSPEVVDEPLDSVLSPLAIDYVPSFPTFDNHPVRSPAPQLVPFPRSSGPWSPESVQSPRSISSPRSSFSRTPSSPVVRSNGKPLKSSLKSASAPHIPDEVRIHFRAKSEPSTPSAKSVHFREEDEIEEVRLYNRAGRPANLLNKPAEETETETEAEGAFPFPRTGSPASPSGVPAPTPQNTLAFDMDMAPGQTSQVPRPGADMYANVHLESLSLPKIRPAAIRGTTPHSLDKIRVCMLTQCLPCLCRIRSGSERGLREECCCALHVRQLADDLGSFLQAHRIAAGPAAAVPTAQHHGRCRWIARRFRNGCKSGHLGPLLVHDRDGGLRYQARRPHPRPRHSLHCARPG